jgi:hypothetical protein
MECNAVQNQIIGLPDPRELSPALRDHVVGCAACLAWARQAARLEALLAQLPVPPAPAEKKEAMIEELTADGPVIRTVPSVPARSGPWFDAAGRFLRRNATAVGGLAAAVLVAGGIYWLASGTGGPKPEVVQTQKHPLLEKMSRANIALARAETPAKRFEALGGMADDLAGETRGMARIASPAELKKLADWYETVVTRGIVQQAKAEAGRHLMNPVEKQKVFDALAARLEADAAEAERVMAETPQESQPALKRMADTAREGHKTLRALARGGV